MAEKDNVAAVAREVLASSNLDDLSEKKLRHIVAERTGVDTSVPDLKQLIHEVVEKFISQDDDEENEEERKDGESASIADRRAAASSDREGGSGQTRAGDSKQQGVKRRAEEDRKGDRKDKGKGSRQDEEEHEEDEDEEDDEGGRGSKKHHSKKKQKRKFQVGDSGELIVCQLSGKRKVTVGEFKGRLFISIREFWEKNGKELPSSKGISLPEDQWEILAKHVDDVNAAIEEAKKG